MRASAEGVCLIMTTSLAIHKQCATTIHATHELALWWSTTLPGRVITLMGPGQHPQYTGAVNEREAVGGSAPTTNISQDVTRQEFRQTW